MKRSSVPSIRSVGTGSDGFGQSRSADLGSVATTTPMPAIRSAIAQARYCAITPPFEPPVT